MVDQNSISINMILIIFIFILLKKNEEIEIILNFININNLLFENTENSLNGKKIKFHI